MGELRITKENIESIQQKLTKFLLDSGYEGTLEDGTGAYDIVVKGNSLVTLYLNDQMEKARAYMSLDEANRLKYVLGPEYDEVIDSILSNWFVSRKGGSQPEAVVRFWFSRPPRILSFSQGDEVAEIDGAQYVAKEDTQFASSDFISEIQPNKFLEEFYVDMEVIAEEDGYHNIMESSDIEVNVANPYFLRGTIHSIVSRGEDQESSEAYIDRTRHVITTREIVSYKAIETVLREEFPDINKIYVAGYGTPEQHRDVVEFDNATVHVGNMSDIYTNGNYEHVTEIFTVNSDGYIDFGEEVVAYVFKVWDPEEEKEVEFSLNRGEEETYQFNSVLCTVYADVGKDYEEKELEVTFLRSNLTSRVHEFVYNDANRVVCYNPLVKSMFPIVLEFEIDIQTSGDVDFDEIKSYVVEYILNLGHKEPYVESKLIDYIHNKVSNVRHIKVPVKSKYYFLKPESLKYLESDFNDYLKIKDIVTDQKQVTENTVEFYTHPELICINTLES